MTSVFCSLYCCDRLPKSSPVRYWSIGSDGIPYLDLGSLHSTPIDMTHGYIMTDAFAYKQQANQNVTRLPLILPVGIWTFQVRPRLTAANTVSVLHTPHQVARQMETHQRKRIQCPSTAPFISASTLEAAQFVTSGMGKLPNCLIIIATLNMCTIYV